MKPASLGVYVVSSVFFLSPIHASSYVYRETTRETHTQYSETLIKDRGGMQLQIQNEKDAFAVHAGPAGDVRQCRIERRKDATVFVAQRSAHNRIQISCGTETMEKSVGGAPWFVSMNALSSFITSAEKRQEFWVLSADFGQVSSVEKGITLVKLVAIKKQAEIVTVDGKPVMATRVVVTFPDWKSMFWKAEYWFRASDGILVRSEQVRGGPGTPKTVVELVQEVQ